MLNKLKRKSIEENKKNLIKTVISVKMVKYHIYTLYEPSKKEKQIKCLEEKLEERNVKSCGTNQSNLSEQRPLELPRGLTVNDYAVIVYVS